MELEQQFLQLSTKFLFLNCGTQIADYRNEINTLLNELNGLNYRAARISDLRSPVRLIESFLNIPVYEDTLIVKACFLVKSLVGRQKIVLPEPVTLSLIVWLRKCLERRFYQVACDVLGTLQLLFRRCSDITQQLDFFLSNNGILVNVLADPDYRRVEPKTVSSALLDQCSSSELYLAAILCLESILICCEPLGVEVLEPYLITVGNAVLDLIFKARPETFTELAYYSLATSAVNCLRIIVSLEETHEWTNNQLGRLIGAAKSFIMYGIPEVAKLVPQRVPVSQQGIPEPQHIPISKGGKTAKTRKTRTHPKSKRGGTLRNSGAGAGGSKEKKSMADGDINRQPYSEASIVLEWSSKCQPPMAGCYQTSDSDYSENEATSSRAQVERHRSAKLRQTALVLVGTLAQHVEKRIMFGYWHALFPDETRTQATVSLLNCVLRDPSPKCRIAAIQATSFLLYKSKPFLIQAESSKKPHVSFTPFSVTLGNMVLEMYAMLTQALTLESDLSVLTQLLKGLTVFIQATPFHRLSPGIARRFVRIVRPLVRHRDATIKVAALMVMGFLISVPDLTEEIAELVGIKKLAHVPTGNVARSKPVSKAFDLELNQEENEEEEALESDPEVEVGCEEETKPAPSIENGSGGENGMSWLLQVTLENLGVNGVASTVMPVRMECLQVLCAMASHYSLLVDHLPMVAEALVNAFGDPLPEIKLYAGRLLDLLGHAIHTELLLQDKIDIEHLDVALQFWTSIIPIVTEQIQDVQLVATLRSVCCDALGNIGVHVYEKFPRGRQLALISLLTGCTFDEDSGVSSAAARALSVYILFPSLRDDVCYVENTIESILRIMRDPNLTARIKTSWSLGNVTDALILNQQHHLQLNHPDSLDDRQGYLSINDEMLRRILEVALDSAKDNDKVRSNAVRTIGNVLHLLRPPQLEQPTWMPMYEDAIERLIQNVVVSSTVNVKVKWNACYALGNMMKNETFFLSGAAGTWERRVFPALCETVVNSPNFKVRINAAQALTVIGKREHFGAFFQPTWLALLQALEQSDNLVDYNEYKRRDSLQEQLCLSLAHLLRLATKDDVLVMASVLLPLYDAVRGNWVRVISRILPEKSAALLESYRVLLEMRKASKGDGETIPASSWDLLLKCFTDSDVC
ncbi:HEAT repeat-containing protein 6 [Anopheles maculipalpis]|uniref:HEAT repeat-containing protein 6 n=1 Tax=Anopheles maculipalpis TaxID=1496333 RepID=UPI0021597409|nr:HEAT repeat-containing protein 6 [Anopheles maculipalpis]